MGSIDQLVRSLHVDMLRFGFQRRPRVRASRGRQQILPSPNYIMDICTWWRVIETVVWSTVVLLLHPSKTTRNPKILDLAARTYGRTAEEAPKPFKIGRETKTMHTTLVAALHTKPATSQCAQAAVTGTGTNRDLTHAHVLAGHLTFRALHAFGVMRKHSLGFIIFVRPRNNAVVKK